MADAEQIAVLKQGAEAWNEWRRANEPLDQVDFSGADLSGMDLASVNLTHADLSGAYLIETNLAGADLTGAHLTQTTLGVAHLTEADLSGANLIKAMLFNADLTEANLAGAYLTGARLVGANLSEANLGGADLTVANLTGACLVRTNLCSANLTKAVLTEATLTQTLLIKALLLETDLSGASLEDCRIYGIAAWGVVLDKCMQKNLIITPYYEPEVVVVDDLSVAQLIYLLLNNVSLRSTISTIAQKAVLILGRFSDERLPVLNAIRDALRQRGYCPILFTFPPPEERTDTEVVGILSRLARFVIADVTEVQSVPHELAWNVPQLLSVPVLPIIQQGRKPYGMGATLLNYPWVMPLHRYRDEASLVADFDRCIVEPAGARAKQLIKRRLEQEGLEWE